MSVGFQWDARKAKLNFSKHRVSFDEASTVFDDPLAVIFDDLDHSLRERRAVIVGHSITDRLLLVCFSERNDMIRIFSARPLTRGEQRDYEENNHNK